MKIFLFAFTFLFSFQINAQWSGAILDSLTHNNVRDVVNHQCIDIDRSDILHVVYSKENSVSGWNIFYKKRDVNAMWSSEESVTSQTGFNPVISASNIPGEAYVAYEAYDTLDEEIYVCSNAGGIWNCFQLTSDTVNDTYPSIAVDSSGFIHLTWISEKSNGNFRIKYASNISGSWVIQELTGGQLGQFGSGASPEIAVDKSGLAHIAYRGNNGNGYRIQHAYNQSPGGTTWNYDFITTPNDEDLSLAIQVDRDTVVHLLVSGDDGFGLPQRAYYQKKTFSATTFSPSVEVAPSYRGQVGDLFVDNNKIPHFVLNEVSGNMYTGNIIYADSNDWNGILLLNSGDIYNANLVMDEEDHAYLLAYRGNSFPDEEVVFYGSSSPVDIAAVEDKETPYKIISTENNLKIYFKENYSGRLSCTTIDGRIVFDNRHNYQKGETISIGYLTVGVYILFAENQEGKFVQKVGLR